MLNKPKIEDINTNKRKQKGMDDLKMYRKFESTHRIYNEIKKSHNYLYYISIQFIQSIQQRIMLLVCGRIFSITVVD